MKRMIMTGVWLVVTLFLKAQTVDEWLKQKETQVRYLVEQIGAIKAYGAVLNKGYEIAHTGLTNIFNSREGDFVQHRAYFLSLSKVKPAVKRFSKVLSAFDMKAGMEKQYGLLNSSASAFLNEKERTYLDAVYRSLLSGCHDLAEELKMVISDGQWQLSDDERMERIDKIYIQMQDRYMFFQSFLNEIKLLVALRRKEGNDADSLYSLYGIK